MFPRRISNCSGNVEICFDASRGCNVVERRGISFVLDGTIGFSFRKTDLASLLCVWGVVDLDNSRNIWTLETKYGG